MKVRKVGIIIIYIILIFSVLLPQNKRYSDDIDKKNNIDITPLPYISNINRCEWNRTWGSVDFDVGSEKK